MPVRIRPAIGARIDHFARTVHVLRLKARCRIGYGEVRIKTIAIQRARAAIGFGFEPSVAGRLHVDEVGRRVAGALNLHLNVVAGRRPEAKARARIVARRAGEMRAERKAMRVVMLMRIDRTFGHD